MEWGYQLFCTSCRLRTPSSWPRMHIFKRPYLSFVMISMGHVIYSILASMWSTLSNLICRTWSLFTIWELHSQMKNGNNVKHHSKCRLELDLDWRYEWEEQYYESRALFGTSYKLFMTKISLNLKPNNMFFLHSFLTMLLRTTAISIEMQKLGQTSLFDHTFLSFVQLLRKGIF